MRLALVADLHGHLPEIPPCDVLVVGGDVTPAHDHDVAFQARWLQTALRPWLEQAPAGEIVAIAGNHDFIFERAPDLVPELPWTYLQDGGCVVDGVRFWGSPWTPWFYDWAFNAPRDEGEPFLRERYAAAQADVLVLHGPPRGFGDRTAAGIDAGSVAALETIDRIAPQVAVFGHIHEARGAWERNGTRLLNAAAVDLRYELRPDPFVVLDVG